MSCVSIVMQCCEELKIVREDIDSYSQRIFQHSCRVAEHSDKYIIIIIIHFTVHEG